MKNQAFTLIELLVVVLIIGILAAIAVPQYQKAVIKSRYSTLKNRTQAIASAVERYFLTHDTYPKNLEDLDISFKITNVSRYQDDSLYIIFSDGSNCEMYYSAPRVYCSDTILGAYMRYGQTYFSSEKMCVIYSTDTTDKWHSICQSETGKSAAQADCNGNWCFYYY